ncbi:MAG: GNAT family N-acetyltransferase [Verrucomicrobiales bacterium]
MIRPITAEQVLRIRHPVLRPGRPIEDAVFPCDTEALARHLGAFDGADRLVGVVTIHPAPWPGGPPDPGPWQLRGMATLPEVRGLGYGRALVEAAERVVKVAGGSFLWCNARVAAVEFYAKLGWEVVGEEFDIPTVGPHYWMKKVP